MRQLLYYVVPLLLPTALYVLYMMWARRRAVSAGVQAPDWREGPIFWFVLGGLVLIIASFVALFVLEPRRGTDAIYRPPRRPHRHARRPLAARKVPPQRAVPAAL